MTHKQFEYAITVLQAHVMEYTVAVARGYCTKEFGDKRAAECNASIAKLSEPTVCDPREALQKPRTIADVTEHGFYTGTIAMDGPSDPPRKTIFFRDPESYSGTDWLFLDDGNMEFSILWPKWYADTVVLQKIEWEVV